MNDSTAFQTSAYPLNNQNHSEQRVDWVQRVIAQRAIRALYQEAALEYKPGLVTPSSSGSHRDMNYSTFLRSLFALRHYFPSIFQAGIEGASFSELQALGVRAEQHMLEATQGVNTHRGAIFNLGLLCAAAGVLTSRRQAIEARALCAVVQENWGPAILNVPSAEFSHGLYVARRYGMGGARQEAAGGFQTALNYALPAYEQASCYRVERNQILLHTLLSLMSHLADSNLVWRGGVSALSIVQAKAQEIVKACQVLTVGWQAVLDDFNIFMVKNNLSPGGSADLLAVSLFLVESDNALGFVI